MKVDERFRQHAERRKEQVTRFLSDLIERPSLSRDEHAVVQRIGDEMTTVGFDEVVVDGFGSAIGRIGNGPVHIVLDSHIDVVDTGDVRLWRTEPFTATIEHGTIYGRGASDNKPRSPRWSTAWASSGTSAWTRPGSPSGSSAPFRRRTATGLP